MSRLRGTLEAGLARLRLSDAWRERLRHHWPWLTYVLLLVVVGVEDSARQWHLDLRPAGAVRVARELASELLPPEQAQQVASWDASVLDLRRDAELEAIRGEMRRRGQDLPASIEGRSSLRFEVDLEHPTAAGRLRFVISGDGRLIEFERLPRAAFEEMSEDLLQATALEGLTRVAAPEPAWQLVSPEQLDQVLDGDVAQPGRLLWRRSLAPELEQWATVEVRRGRVDGILLELRPSDELAALADDLDRIDDNIPGILMLLVFGVLLWQSFRYRIVWIASLVLALYVGMTLLVVGLVMRGVPGPLHPVEQVFYAFLVFTAGHVALRRYRSGAVESLELALRGRLDARKVGWAVRAGLRWGGVLGLAAYLPALLGLPLRPVATDALAAADRGIGPLLLLVPRVSLALLAVFAFLLPWFAVWMPRRLAQGAAVALGGVLVALEFGAEGPVGVQWFSGLLLVSTALVLFERRDLLAVLVAGFGASVAISAGALLLQPVRLLDALLLLVGLFALARLARRRARDGRPLSLAPRLLKPQQRLSAQRDQLERELSLAREAQMHMLPAAPPALSGYSIAAVCRPARDVGGDIYDFVPVPGGLGLAVGDVSGKGMVASLYMTLTKGLLLAASEHCGDVAAAICEMHRGLHAAVDRKTFVTFWYGWLDLERRKLEYARAGHNPVLWRRVQAGATASLAAPGLALGSTKAALFERILRSASVDLETGDALFLYSDGLPEAMNEAGEEYGEERLVAAVERTDGLDAEQALNVVMADVVAFAGDAAQHDDMTLVVVRVE